MDTNDMRLGELHIANPDDASEEEPRREGDGGESPGLSRSPSLSLPPTSEHVPIVSSTIEIGREREGEDEPTPRAAHFATHLKRDAANERFSAPPSATSSLTNFGVPLGGASASGSGSTGSGADTRSDSSVSVRSATGARKEKETAKEDSRAGVKATLPDVADPDYYSAPPSTSSAYTNGVPVPGVREQKSTAMGLSVLNGEHDRSRARDSYHSERSYHSHRDDSHSRPRSASRQASPVKAHHHVQAPYSDPEVQRRQQRPPPAGRSRSRQPSGQDMPRPSSQVQTKKSREEDWAERGAAVMKSVDGARIIKKGVKDFQFGRTLGEGSYSTVMAATDRTTLKEYAIKVLDKRHIIKEKKVKYVNIEKNTLNRLGDHPGILRLFYTFQDERSLYFVLDLASNGELLGFIKKLGTFDEECTRYYAAQILDAVDYMHSRGVIHRDLKPENVLLDDKMRIKIADFGTAKILELPKPGEEGEIDDRANSFVGTAEYVSPELLSDKSTCRSSDLWAFGCILYQLLAGRPPFKASNEYQIFQKIVKLEYSFPPSFPADAQDLVERCLVLDPSKRIRAEEIKSHPFFEGVEWTRDGVWKRKAPRLKPYRPEAVANGGVRGANGSPAVIKLNEGPPAGRNTSTLQPLGMRNNAHASSTISLPLSPSYGPSTGANPMGGALQAPLTNTSTVTAPPAGVTSGTASKPASPTLRTRIGIPAERPKSTMDIQSSNLLTSPNEFVLKSGPVLVQSSSNAPAPNADGRSKLAKFLNLARKKHRVLLVTSAGRALFLEAGGVGASPKKVGGVGKEKVKTEVLLGGVGVRVRVGIGKDADHVFVIDTPGKSYMVEINQGRAMDWVDVLEEAQRNFAGGSSGSGFVANNDHYRGSTVAF
ncbi:serine/threonine protein kinase [Saitoella coloradoensis]